jgi:ribosomal protein L35AE/L33A
MLLLLLNTRFSSRRINTTMHKQSFVVKLYPNLTHNKAAMYVGESMLFNRNMQLLRITAIAHSQ